MHLLIRALFMWAHQQTGRINRGFMHDQFNLLIRITSKQGFPNLVEDNNIPYHKLDPSLQDVRDGIALLSGPKEHEAFVLALKGILEDHN